MAPYQEFGNFSMAFINKEKWNNFFNINSQEYTQDADIDNSEVNYVSTAADLRRRNGKYFHYEILDLQLYVSSNSECLVPAF